MTAAQVGRWYPDGPPPLPDESDNAYTSRITGVDGTGRVPYDHRRGRECAMTFHLTCQRWCSRDSACECPCHSDSGVQGVVFIPNSGPAERLATLYHLPARTAERVIHLAEQAVDEAILDPDLPQADHWPVAITHTLPDLRTTLEHQ